MIRVMDETCKEAMRWMGALLVVALVSITLAPRAAAQDQAQDEDQNQRQYQNRDQSQNQDQDDPPSRVARLGYMEGSVSFQPAGESEWVSAVPNRPMTTGDKLWTDQNSRVEVQLGSAVIRLTANTGFSFLNLDDHTVQVQLSSGSVNIRIRRLGHDENFEIDTPNLAFSAFEPGSYRVDASEDGNYTVVTIRDGGGGEATGNGQTFKLHPGQRATFDGTQSLNADIVEVGDPDAFDTWAFSRDRRSEESPSARYVSHEVVGYEDLDQYGEWRDDPSYGHVWYPTQVSAEWAPYRNGHWAWISPWGWTWVDDAPWGYAPFHYGRWVSVEGRWGWVAGPPEVQPVYAPALVVFVGGGGPAVGGNVAWFPLGPREVYVPSYHVGPEYVNRVNVSNTNVNTTTVTNVYNTTIINNTTTNNTNINNVKYVNRSVNGAVTAVPQRAFTSAQPVARAAVPVSARQIASAPVSLRADVAPTQNSVLGVHANTASHVAAPPAAIANRAVVAKAVPPPPPIPFAKQQQALAAHPGQPLARQEVQTLRPANAAAAQPLVKQATPARPAAPNMARPASQPSQPANFRPASQPENHPAVQPALNERSGASSAPPSRPVPINQPASNARPNGNRPQPNNRSQNSRPEPNQPATARPETNRPQVTPSAFSRPAQPAMRSDRPAAAQPNNHPSPPPHQQAPEEKKRQDEQHKGDEKPQK